MNHVHTQKSKPESGQTIQRFMTYVKRRYGCTVRIIRIDGETSLSKEFEDQMDEEGVTIERSPPYTQAQNGAIERSGALIMIKARCLRIAARLPENLWPEPTKAGGYLLNRTPTRKLG